MIGSGPGCVSQCYGVALLQAQPKQLTTPNFSLLPNLHPISGTSLFLMTIDAPPKPKFAFIPFSFSRSAGQKTRPCPMPAPDAKKSRLRRWVNGDGIFLAALVIVFVTAIAIVGTRIQRTSPADNLFIHDPAAIYANGHYYVFGGGDIGPGVPYYKSQGDSMDGPWARLGEVLPNGSKIHQPNEHWNAPWAPAVIQRNNTFYVFYATTVPSSRKSAIGVAACVNPDAPDTWIDYGALIHTGQGPDANKYPFAVSNAIDPSVLIHPQTGTPILQFGSYWDGIFQVPLSDDVLSLRDKNEPFNSSHIVYNGAEAASGKGWHVAPHPIEGSALSYHDPYYYVYYAHGACCGLARVASAIPVANVYEIRIGRSTNATGPFTDKDGVDLLQGGGSTFLASHDDVYAPGGPSVLQLPNGQDIFYYHYLNRNGDLEDKHALLGWNTMSYGDDGWPQLTDNQPDMNSTSPSAAPGAKL